MSQSGKKDGGDKSTGTGKAAKTSQSRRTGKSAASQKTMPHGDGDTVRKRVIDETLKLITERGWRRTSVADVIAAAGISDSAYVREFDSLLSVLVAASRQLNAAMVEAKADFDDADSVRERLFALLMARFDAANPWRPAIKELAQAAPYDPVLAATALKVMMTVAAQALSAAGIKTTGPLGFARANSFMAGVVLPASQVWLYDDTPALDKTMVALDRSLDRAERIVGRLRRSGCN